MAHCAIQEPVHPALEQLIRVAFHRVGIPYHAKHTTQTHFFAQCFRDTKKTRAAVVAQNPPTLVRKRAMVAVSYRWLWRAFHTTASVCILAYTHIVITAPATSTLTETPCLIARPATQTLFLPHLARARASANTDFLYTYFGHTCHAHKHATLHIYSCHTCHTQNHICSYILAAPATEKHKHEKRKQNKKTNQKLPQSLEQRFFGGSSLLIAPIAIDMHGFSFLIFGIAAVPNDIHQKNPKLRLQHTWFLENGFVTIFSRNQDIKNNNGEFAILKLL